MKARSSLSTVSGLGLAALLSMSPAAHALTVPDSGTCSASGVCLQITTSGSGAAVGATSTSGAAVLAKSTTGSAISATTSNGGLPIYAEGSSGLGSVYGVQDGTGPGVSGFNQNSTGGPGVAGRSYFGDGVDGVSSGAGYAVYGHSSSQFTTHNIGVVGQTDVGGIAVVGYSSDGTGIGVQGWSTSGTSAVQGNSGGNATGVQGSSASGAGVSGQSATGLGVFGVAGHNNAVYGVNSDTDNSAATISAQPGGSSGLAYWGGGNIELTGSHAWKNGGSVWEPLSDRRVKRDVKDFSQGLPEVLKVHPVRFRYNGLGGTTDDGKEFVGVIAQELEKVSPEMVSSRARKLRANDATETEIKYVDPNNFTYMLINAVQQQQKVIDRQGERIEALEQGRPPLASAISPFGRFEAGIMVGLLPVGLIVALRRRKQSR